MFEETGAIVLKATNSLKTVLRSRVLIKRHLGAAVCINHHGTNAKSVLSNLSPKTDDHYKTKYLRQVKEVMQTIKF